MKFKKVWTKKTRRPAGTDTELRPRRHRWNPEQLSEEARNEGGPTWDKRGRVEAPSGYSLPRLFPVTRSSSN